MNDDDIDIAAETAENKAAEGSEDDTKKPKLSAYISIGNLTRARPLDGSDVTLAQCIADDIRNIYEGDVPHCEGEFWYYTGTHWTPLLYYELRLHAHLYNQVKPLRGRIIDMSKGRLDSILYELTIILHQERFFDDAPTGINCRNGFIKFDTNGKPTRHDHHRANRQRHVLPGNWSGDVSSSLRHRSRMEKLLTGSFKDDPDGAEKINLLAELAGVTALGYAPRLKQPRAVILFGEDADNGKSQILDMMRGLLPDTATSAIPPGKFGDDRHLVKLKGKLLNAGDELSSARAIASDTFKATITGNVVTARDVYKSSGDFKPVAQHIFATNKRQRFQGGMDKGVRRRLLIVLFNRSIPIEEQVDRIGMQICEQEADELLGWAVAGASRIIPRGYFNEPQSCKDELRNWVLGTDPVEAWCEEALMVGFGVVGEKPPRLSSKNAYIEFKGWTDREGYREAKNITRRNFVDRVSPILRRKGVAYSNSGGFRGWIGARIRSEEKNLTYEDLKRPLTDVA